MKASGASPQLHLDKLGFTTSATATAEQALRMLEESPYDVLLTDLHLPGMSGVDLLKRVKMEHPDMIVIVITAFGTVASAVEAMKSGAYDYVTKPLQHYALKELVQRAIDHRQLTQEVGLLRACLDQKYGFENIVGSSARFAHTISLASRAAASDATILITGETGTGKELLAKAIHFRSLRRHRPMVTINCGAIPRDLLESELFGHVKGSFTGALTHKKGRIEAADGGTVFLDEIGEMPFELQVRILRLIQEREIDKIGSTRRPRLTSGSSPLRIEIWKPWWKTGPFGKTCITGLPCCPSRFPLCGNGRPTSSRWCRTSSKRANRSTHCRTSDCRRTCCPPLPPIAGPATSGSWRTSSSASLCFVTDNEITMNDLPEPMRAAAVSDELIRIELPAQGLDLEAVEKELLTKALHKFDGNQSRAAAYLNISRKTFLHRLAKFGIARHAIGSAKGAFEQAT